MTDNYMFFLLPFLIISGITFIKKREVLSTVSFFGISSVLFIIIFKNFYHDFRYFIPILPFLIVVITNVTNKILKLKPNLKNTIFKILFISILIIMCFSTIKVTSQYILSLEFKQLQKEVGGGLTLITGIKGYILTDKQERLSEFYFPHDPNKVHQWPSLTARRLSYIDTGAGESLEQAGVLNEEWKNTWQKVSIGEASLTTPKELNFYYDNIKNGFYDLIILGKPSEYSNIFSVITDLVDYDYKKEGFDFFDLSTFLLYIEKNNLPIKCFAVIPTLEEKCKECSNSLFLFFKDREPCSILKSKLKEYYLNQFDSICKKDEFIWNEVIKPLGFNQKCNSGADLLTALEERRLITTNKDLFFLISALMLTISYFTTKFLRYKNKAHI